MLKLETCFWGIFKDESSLFLYLKYNQTKRAIITATIKINIIRKISFPPSKACSESVEPVPIGGRVLLLEVWHTRVTGEGLPTRVPHLFKSL